MWDCRTAGFVVWVGGGFLGFGVWLLAGFLGVVGVVAASFSLCVLFGLDFGFIFWVLFGGGLWIGCGGLWTGIVRLRIIVFAC